MFSFLMALFMAGWQAAGDPLPAAARNTGFEAVAADGVPADWQVSKRDPGEDYRFEGTEGSTGKGGRLFLATGETGAGASIFQKINAAPFRGKLVRLHARLLVRKAGDRVGLGLAVTRPQPKFAGFRYGMEDRPIAEGDWKEVAIVGRVAPDAVEIRLALDVSGAADVTIDDLTLEPVSPNPAPPSEEAKAYLEHALGLIRAYHIDSAKADWDRIAADAHAEIGGAKTVGDTHGAIRGVLGALGEKHSFLRIPAKAGAAKPGRAAPAKPPLPEWKLVDSRYGLVRLPMLNTFAEGGEAHGKAYQRIVEEGLRAMDAQPVCGWIVDLRSNGGGNMWPMLQGLDPLLGAAPFGSFVDTKGGVTWWQRLRGELIPAADRPQEQPPAYGLRHAGAPVAVLLGPKTASSGEMTAMALIGRAKVRTFGEPSGGYTTGNSVYPLSDGALLILTGVFSRDRTGKQYDGEIQPDVKTSFDDAQAEAIRWLATQCPRG